MGRKKTHGESFSRLYDIWSCMKTRCSNKKHPHFHRYGGRGIIVCDEWKRSYEAFRDWALSNGYHEDLTIDRIDNNGNYEPSNCHWISQKEQMKNRNCARVFEGKSLSEWAQLTGIKRRTLAGRLERGWSWEDALSIPYKGVWRYRTQLPPELRV